jgi:hypothetical protein
MLRPPHSSCASLFASLAVSVGVGEVLQVVDRLVEVIGDVIGTGVTGTSCMLFEPLR